MQINLINFGGARVSGIYQDWWFEFLTYKPQIVVLCDILFKLVSSPVDGKKNSNIYILLLSYLM